MEKYHNHERIHLEEGCHLIVGGRHFDSDYHLHWHSHFEIEIYQSGEGICRINGRDYPYPKYSLFFLTPTDFHFNEVHRPVSFMNISFDEEFLSEMELSLLLTPEFKRGYALSAEEHRRLLAAGELLRHECETNGECQVQLLQYILSHIIRLNPKVSVQNNLESHGLKKAITYMQLHFKEPITMDEIAAEAGYHPAYFGELYKKTVGETCLQTLCKLRLGCSRMLLANGVSVSDACYQSGFGSVSNFCLVFKRQYGIPPGEYKRKKSGNKNDQ